MAGSATPEGHGAATMMHAAMPSHHDGMTPAPATTAPDNCPQLCLAATAILTEALPPVADPFRAIHPAPDPDRNLASLSPDPTRPPPKSAAI